MHRRFTRCLTLCMLFVFLLFPLADIHAQESYHSLELGAGTAIPARGLLGEVEYAFHWRPFEYVGFTPYLRINLNALGELDAWATAFNAANTWAGENSWVFNILLAGIPYVLATAVGLIESQWLFCPGIEMSFHPLHLPYLDASLRLGLKNDPFRFLQKRADEDQYVLFLYPVGHASARLAFLYKALVVDLWASYEYDIIGESQEVYPHGFFWGASLGWRFGIFSSSPRG